MRRPEQRRAVARTAQCDDNPRSLDPEAAPRLPRHLDPEAAPRHAADTQGLWVPCPRLVGQIMLGAGITQVSQ